MKIHFGPTYQTIWCHNLQDHNMHVHAYVFNRKRDRDSNILKPKIFINKISKFISKNMKEHTALQLRKPTL